ncbi:MAG: flagellar basal body P-ring protein FlgI [Pirellulales bacterium]|nr:flagellar basal body P-ring protein FlgI [Pirellulales bacterium]
MKFHRALRQTGVAIVRTLAFLVMFAPTGCTSWTPWAVRSQSPEEPDAASPETRLVGDMAVPFGMFPVKIEAVGLVTGLKGTGSDPRPSPQRAALLAEMQTRGVKSPNTILASQDTAMVLVRGVLPPAIQKGDRFDIEVRIPGRDDTSSLRGGWLLETRLKEMAAPPGENQIHEGNVLALASGPVLVDPSASEKDNPVLLGRGRILGGGEALKSRPLALVLKPDHQTVLNSSRIETAVNRRFHTFQRGIKVGMAKAKTNEYVELTLHPRYKDNVQRYVEVVRATALRESESEMIDRLRLLERQLFDPVASSRAALQLEAIGKQGVELLKKGVKGKDPEVRFYSAEALAYLDETDAVEPLAEAARNQPAFRVFALAALSAMDDFVAYDALRNLLEVNSVETRYGAFRSLWAMNSSDPLVQGQRLGDQFSYHVLKTAGPPLIHVTRSHRPEIVLFGADQRFQAPMAVEAGNQIMVTSTKPGEVAIAKFAVNQPDQKRIVSDRVDEVVRAIVELGGTYPDVVQALQDAKAKGSLPSRFEVDAVPEAGRSYRRVAGSNESDEATEPGASSPMPDLFKDTVGKHGPSEGVSEASDEETAANPSDSPRKPRPVRDFFGKMMGRSSG